MVFPVVVAHVLLVPEAALDLWSAHGRLRSASSSSLIVRRWGRRLLVSDLSHITSASSLWVFCSQPSPSSTFCGACDLCHCRTLELLLSLTSSPTTQHCEDTRWEFVPHCVDVLPAFTTAGAPRHHERIICGWRRRQLDLDCTEVYVGVSDKERPRHRATASHRRSLVDNSDRSAWNYRKRCRFLRSVSAPSPQTADNHHHPTGHYYDCRTFWPMSLLLCSNAASVGTV